MNNEELKLLSISEAAKLLGIGRRALRSLILNRKSKRYIIKKSVRINTARHLITRPDYKHFMKHQDAKLN